MLPSQIVDRLIRLLPDSVAFQRGKGNCIEATRICHDVLRAAGVDVRPLACAVWAGNAAGAAAAASGLTVDQWPAGAWAVGIDPDLPYDTDSCTQERRTKVGFSGHLIMYGPETEGWWWWADVTAQQFSRPQYGIDVKGALTGVTELDPSTETVVAHLGGTAAVIYRPRPELARWRRTPAWRQDLNPAVVAALAEAVVE